MHYTPPTTTTTMNRITPLFTYRIYWLFFTSLLILNRASYSAKIDNDGHREFADTFTNELFSSPNECSSTWGISMIMDVIRPGASKKQLVKELCNGMALCSSNNNRNDFKSMNTLLWDNTVDRLTTTYNGKCSYDNGNRKCTRKVPTLQVANGVWIDMDDTLVKAYNDTVGEYLHQINFLNENAGSKINKWVKQSTKGLIDSIIDDGPIENYDLVAVNSIYLKASWEKQFKTRNTNVDLFYPAPTINSPTSTLKADNNNNMANFMHQVGDFMYSDTALAGFQLLKLDYANSDMAMLIALPTTTTTIAATVPPTATATDVVAALPSLESTRIALAIPKFKFESEYDTQKLRDAFKAVGITRPFESTDYCGLVKGMCLYIDEMIQKTSIEVDEMGTVAAAVTAVMMARSAPIPKIPVLFQADHPFNFYIYDANEDLVLFEGRVGGDLVSESSAELKSQHLESDFWEKNFGVTPIKNGNDRRNIRRLTGRSASYAS